MYIEEEEGFLVRLGKAGEPAAKKAAEEAAGVCFQETALLRRTKEEVLEYLKEERKCFDIPLRPDGTAFQKRIWEALQQIPWGETRTYGQIAVMAGCEKGARAAGQACNKNPIMILVPCHRVMGGDGRLTGFGGGLPMKRAFLTIEGIPWKE